LFAVALPTAAMKGPAKLSVDDSQAALEIPACSSYVLALPIGACSRHPRRCAPKRGVNSKRLEMPIWMKC
jgi:hypothetical protein